MKLLGQHIWDYYKAWPLGDDWYLEGDIAIDDGLGNPAISLTEKYDPEDFGYLRLALASDDRSFGREISKWIKAQSHTSIVVTLPRDQAETLIKYCNLNQGWKVTQ